MDYTPEPAPSATEPTELSPSAAISEPFTSSTTQTEPPPATTPIEPPTVEKTTPSEPLVTPQADQPTIPESTPTAPEPAQTEEALTNNPPITDPAAEPSPSEQTPAPERIIEKTIPRELTEEEHNQRFKTRLKTLSIKGNTARTTRRQKNLETIIEYLRTNGYITNNDVEKICKVKNSTAINYLSALEKQGRIIQLGRTGRRVRYRLREATS